MVPLSAFARFETGHTALAVNHQEQVVTSTISFNLKPGQALSDATAVLQRTMREIGMPATIHGAYAGTAAAFQKTLRSELLLVFVALAAVYIVLGILYESYIQPVTILSTLPSAGVGAVLALDAFNMQFTIIALIGIFLLIGIVKKNAILMIDLALQIERGGVAPREAIRTACLRRFRPILMTTLAAAMGVLPLALGVGEGAELRQPLGISIVGGLLASQLLTLYTTPVVYLYLETFSTWLRRHRPHGASAPSSVPRWTS
jgi:multidrug efflux pump